MKCPKCQGSVTVPALTKKQSSPPMATEPAPWYSRLQEDSPQQAKWINCPECGCGNEIAPDEMSKLTNCARCGAGFYPLDFSKKGENYDSILGLGEDLGKRSSPVSCPNCGRMTPISDEQLSTSVKCSGCETRFIPAEAKTKSQKKKPEGGFFPLMPTNHLPPDEVYERKPFVEHTAAEYLVTEKMPGSNESHRACPFCAETILADAVKCRFCGEMLEAGSKEYQERITPRANAQQFIQTGEGSIPTGNAALIGGIIFAAVGCLFFVGGMGGLILFFFMDTTVPTLGYGRVYNIGLMSEKQNGITVSAIVTALGALSIGASIFCFILQQRSRQPSQP